MSIKYSSLSLVEKQSWDDVNEQSMPEGEDRRPNRQTFIAKIQANYIWLIHGFLLLLSGSMFICSLLSKPSTLEHVQRFSAWSPAAEAVEYQTVRYNLSTKGNRFVGKGPEVDQAWREISYDGMQLDKSTIFFANTIQSAIK
jgi:hypothetical protein